MINTIKLHIADHFALRRQSLTHMLRSFNEFEVLKECSAVFELMEIKNSNTPDVIIIDRNLPSINDVDPISMIHNWNKSLRLLVLSDSQSPAIAIKTLQNGAAGFVSRIDNSESLIQGIKRVHLGERFISPMINDGLLDSVISGVTFGELEDERISSREKEILNLIIEGKSYKEIGNILFISTRTVETHRNNIMRKLGLTSQIDIIKYAFKNGMISLD